MFNSHVRDDNYKIMYAITKKLLSNISLFKKHNLLAIDTLFVDTIHFLFSYQFPTKIKFLIHFLYQISASVARITKYFYNDGLPLITTGGYSFNYVGTKQSCDDEFYMLLRAGFFSFKDIAFFSIKLLEK